MYYYVDRNYPGTTYVVSDELNERFVQRQQTEGACLKKTLSAQKYDDIFVVTGVNPLGLDGEEAEWHGVAFVHDGYEYEHGTYCDEEFLVYKQDDKIVRLVDGSIKEVSQWDDISDHRKPLVTVYADENLENEDEDDNAYWDIVEARLWCEKEEEKEESEKDKDFYRLERRLLGERIRE